MAEIIQVDLNALPVSRNYRARVTDWIRETFHVELNTSGTYADEDLSGCTIALYVLDADGTTVVNAKAITASGSGSNEIVMEIDPASDLVVGQTWAAGVYTYRIQVTWPDTDLTFTNGMIKNLVAGKITVDPNN